MITTIKITGIKRAVGEFNRWQGAARIYLDTSTGEVWTKIYTAPNWETKYHDSAIVQVLSKSTYNMYGRGDKITMQSLRDMCESEMKRVAGATNTGDKGDNQ